MLTVYASTVEYLTGLAARLEPVAFDLWTISTRPHCLRIIKYLPLPARLAIHGLLLLHGRRLPGLQAVYTDLRPRHGHDRIFALHNCRHDTQCHRIVEVK